MTDAAMERVRRAFRDVPDFPKPGILFKDITPILSDPALFRSVIDHFTARHRIRTPDRIAAIESRGFIFGAALADRLGVGFVPIRKKGKLPHKTVEVTYELEYGSATIEVHVDAFAPGQQVLIIDDVLATGGTAAAAAALVEKLGARVLELDFLVELSFLAGRERLAGHAVHAPIIF